jgi:hypothetical protein
MARGRNDLTSGLLKPVRAAVFLITHTALACLVILCIYGVEMLITYLWRDHDGSLLGAIPLRYVFDAIDLGVLVVFGIRGIIAAYRAFQN